MPRTRHIAKAQAMNIPYQHSFKTCKVQKTKVSENQVRRTRSLGGQMHGDSDSRSGRPLKGPKNVRPASLWHFYLHRTWRTCADRQGLQPHWSVSRGLRLPFIQHAALLRPVCQTLLILAWELMGMVSRELRKPLPFSWLLRWETLAFTERPAALRHLPSMRSPRGAGIYPSEVTWEPGTKAIPDDAPVPSRRGSWGCSE